jgi:hypothetical protein
MSSKPTDAVIEKIIASCDGKEHWKRYCSSTSTWKLDFASFMKLLQGSATQNSWRRFTELEHAETLQHFSAQARSGLARQ